ncbi:hypothetical protein OESDEN_11826 [Oesophagostomum dentatum]|uniref:Uncharacterized protein n=1 Tax=Oesophagostomum dentatum TaxID=61180 RepID=A0A0B1SWT6_OESDE|nr:hypothetical protein OESDEN_11826 [Oesophagostomum dentatum]
MPTDAPTCGVDVYLVFEPYPEKDFRQCTPLWTTFLYEKIEEMNSTSLSQMAKLKNITDCPQRQLANSRRIRPSAARREFDILISFRKQPFLEARSPRSSPMQPCTMHRSPSPAGAMAVSTIHKAKQVSYLIYKFLAKVNIQLLDRKLARAENYIH